MTATSYVDLNNDDLGANKIFRAATASALDTNPVSIAQRGPSAPWLNGVGAITKLTSGSGNWTVPAGVYRIKVAAVGGGGGSTTGGDSTFGALTGSGGGSSGAGGAATGGDVNISGGNGQAFSVTGFADFPMSVVGGYSALGGDAGRGRGVSGNTGGGGSLSLSGGGGGGTAIGVLSVDPGDLIAYSVGAAGTGASAGIIIIEY